MRRFFPARPSPAGAAAERPGLLLNVTNDAWFGMTSGPYQHFAQARLRAIEEGLPLIRAANTGISAIVDPYGRVVAELPLGAEGVLDGGLPQRIDAAAFREISVRRARFCFGLAVLCFGLGHPVPLLTIVIKCIEILIRLLALNIWIKSFSPRLPPPVERRQWFRKGCSLRERRGEDDHAAAHLIVIRWNIRSISFETSIAPAILRISRRRSCGILRRLAAEHVLADDDARGWREPAATTRTCLAHNAGLLNG